MRSSLTPILRHANRKFSTFSALRSIKLGHGRRWHMYTGHGPGPHMVGYMTKNDTVSQSSRNVLGHSNTQPRFNLQPQLIDVRIRSGRLFHIMPSVDRPVASVEAVGGRGHGIVAAASIVMPI